MQKYYFIVQTNPDILLKRKGELKYTYATVKYNSNDECVIEYGGEK